MEKYIIYNGQTAAGEATLDKQGMYYKITCRLFPIPNTKCHVEIQAEEKQTIDLGLCIPYDSFFGCVRFMPIKALGQGNARFILRNEYIEERFIPILEHQRFLYLQKIPVSKLVKQNNLIGIWIKQQENHEIIDCQ